MASYINKRRTERSRYRYLPVTPVSPQDRGAAYDSTANNIVAAAMSDQDQGQVRGGSEDYVDTLLEPMQVTHSQMDCPLIKYSNSRSPGIMEEAPE